MKLKQFCNEFDVLYSKENNPGLGEDSASQTVEHSTRRIWGKNEFQNAWEEGM